MRLLTMTLAGVLFELMGFSYVQASDVLKAHLAQNLSPISGVALIAESRGIFKSHGLDIEISNFSSGKQCLDTILAGGADIATTAEAPITAAAMAHQPIAYVAGMEFSDVKTLTSRASGITDRTDLKGKKIAFTAGTGSEVYTAALLKSAGLTAKDVTLVSLKPQEMLAAMAAGSIDAMNTWEPHVANARRALGDKVVPLETRGVYSETFNIVVMQSFLAAQPQTVRAFLASLIEAEAWMKQHPDEAIGIVAKDVGMKTTELKEIWSDYVFHVAIGDKQLSALKAHAQWRLETKNHPPGVDKMPDLSQIIYPSSLQKLDASRVTYGH